MRRLTSFICEGETLAASLDDAGGNTGVLLVIGGSQTRIGSHRMYERLAKALAEKGFPCFRYDRRGVGDSSGDDPGFEGSEPDLRAAAAAFRAECTTLKSIYGFGLCDGATTLALYGSGAELSGVVLVNPWLVETDSDMPAPAAIKAHYRKRLTSIEGWKAILSGSINYRRLFTGVRKLFTPSKRKGLADRAAFGLTIGAYPVRVILAEGDSTAIAAAAELKKPNFAGVIEGCETVGTDSHTFARSGDEEALLAAAERALGALAPHAS